MSPFKRNVLERRAEYFATQKANDEAASLLWKDSGAAHERMNVAIRQHIREDKLLNVATWTLCIRNGEVYLYAKEDSRDIKELSELTETYYHSKFPLVYDEPREDDEYRKELVTLRFDDGDVCLIFDSKELVNPFIKEYGLKVDTSGVDDQIAEHQSSIDTLKQLKELVKS